MATVNVRPTIDGNHKKGGLLARHTVDLACVFVLALTAFYWYNVQANSKLRAEVAAASSTAVFPPVVSGLKISLDGVSTFGGALQMPVAGQSLAGKPVLMLVAADGCGGCDKAATTMASVDQTKAYRACRSAKLQWD